jgi:hypothetical protein
MHAFKDHAGCPLMGLLFVDLTEIRPLLNLIKQGPFGGQGLKIWKDCLIRHALKISQPAFMKLDLDQVA